MTHLYDLDNDGYYDSAYTSSSLDVDPCLSSSSVAALDMPGSYYGPENDLDYGLNVDYGGGYDRYDGYGGYEEGLWDAGYGGGYAGECGGIGGGTYESYPDLYDYMDFVPETGGVGIYDAWGDSSWAQEQYELADLMHYQRQLNLDLALSSEERLARWEQRLAFEELDEATRRRRYVEYDPYTLRNLGLSGGFWGRRFGGRDVDLSYLREVPLRRGLFGAPYRERFARHRNLGRRYSPFFSRQRFRAFAGPRVDRAIAPRPAARYESRRLSDAVGTGTSIRERELIGRLRVAEMRASLSGLTPAQRAAALSDARRLRAELNEESRLAREIDRSERRADALLAARQAEREREELREERRELEGIGRLERAAEELERAPLPGAGWGGGGRPYY